MFDPGAKLTLEQERLLTQEVLNTCEGRWDHVLPMIIPELQEAIDKGHRRHVTCIFPDHGAKDKFRITDKFNYTGSVICTCTANDKVGSGISLIMRARNVDFKTARNLLVDALGISVRGRTHSKPTPLPPIPVRKEVDVEAVKAEAKRVKLQIASIWNDTVDLTDPAAEPALLWFENRGVTPLRLPLADVRYHHGLRYYDGQNYVGTFPCIVSMIRDNAGLTRTLHRTYITADGKKPVEIPAGKTRKLHPVPCDRTASGGAVRIDEPTNCLNLAEGIETALSVRRLTRLPTWACLSKDLLRNVEIPDTVRFITIWADKDRSDAGQQAAAELVMRLRQEGRKAVAMLPPGEMGAKSLDWNDLLMDHGIDEVRRMLPIKQWQRSMQRLLGAPPSSTGIIARAFT